MPYQNIIVEKRGRIVCMTINRPQAMNAYTTPTTEEFTAAFTEYRDNPEEWAMIITGTGDKAFCAGQDMREMNSYTVEERRTGTYDNMRAPSMLMQSIQKPFIAAVNGYCVGGGWHMVADADIVIASENAVFLDTHVNVGLINGVESTGLVQKMPLGIVLRMVIEGRHFRVSAQQAYQWGLASEIVAADKLMPRAWEIATHITEESAPLAVQGSKKAIWGGRDRGLSDAILYAWKTLPEIAHTEDVIEGPRAFVEKRKPRFTGK